MIITLLIILLGQLSLIRPLAVVAMEERNPRRVRTFAVDHLRQIHASMGIRQGAHMAELVAKSLEAAQDAFTSEEIDRIVPLLPFC